MLFATRKEVENIIGVRRFEVNEMTIRPSPRRVVRIQVVEAISGKPVKGTWHMLTVYETTAQEVYSFIRKAIQKSEPDA